MLYGPRAPQLSRGSARDGNVRDSGSSTAAERNIVALLDGIAGYQVPHSWFLHFYIVSLAASLFWAMQYLSHDGLIVYVASHVGSDTGTSMTSSQVVLMWMLLIIHSARRLYESASTGQSSASTMWIGHWALGVLFYVLTSCAVWIEGARKLCY